MYSRMVYVVLFLIFSFAGPWTSQALFNQAREATDAEVKNLLLASKASNQSHLLNLFPGYGTGTSNDPVCDSYWESKFRQFIGSLMVLSVSEK